MSLHVEIVTPKGMVLQADVEAIVLPGKLGEFAVLQGHLPLLAALKPGVVSYLADGQTHRLAISAGFAEVGAQDRVLVLTDASAKADTIDLDAVRREMREAEEALSGWDRPIEELDTKTNAWSELADHRALRQRVDWAQARINLSNG